MRVSITRLPLTFGLSLLAMAALVGAVCAGFLWALDAVTRLRFAAPWLLYGLPLCGAGVALLYRRFGPRAEGGNNLILDEIHEPGGGVPLAMAPLIFLGTVATHMFGGSAGREGTAVQLGGSLAHGFIDRLGLTGMTRRHMLMGGVAAGFGAVFGTPLAGTVFAVEVLALGGLDFAALVPCLVAALVGDQVCRFWGAKVFGVHHTAYPALAMPLADLAGWGMLLGQVLVLGLACGLVARLFAEANHGLADHLRRLVPSALWRPVIGGLAVIGLTFALGTQDYLGLGVLSAHPGMPTLPGFFSAEPDRWSWLFKLVFTVVTLATGFKGGEVTPLFFIGAGLGSALSSLLGLPVPLAAGLGMVALFAAAANTPVACVVMGMELFGPQVGPLLVVACVVAYLASGHGGIYLSQKIARPKWPRRTAGASLRAVRRKTP